MSINKPENVKLYKFQHKSFNSITATAKGVIDNFDYFVLEVEGTALSRIDGNHRLEAGKDKNLQVPFSIILWNLDDSNAENLINPEIVLNNTDSEAFLFYILNNTAKKLEFEENYKGLVKSKTWTNDELSLINKNLPLLQYFFYNYINNPLFDSTWLDKPLSQVEEIISDINDENIDCNVFDGIYKDTIALLSQDTISPKYVFVAMEYKSEKIVSDYNDCFKRAMHTLNNMGSNMEIECYPIMTGEGKSINITEDIYKKIDECAIFVADITEANPNVMYELGIAFSKSKPIILVREKNKKIRVPSDIISEYYYSFDGMYELERILIEHIKKILETEYGAVFPG